MRIISGKWKSRRLYSVKGDNTRPTSDRVKEAVFNILRYKINNSVILDVFAGTGNMGFEALSRGSNEAVFIERDARAARVIKKNADALKCNNIIHIIKNDVFRAIDYLSKGKYIFDIIFIDPPYNLEIEHKVIQKIIDADIMDRQGIIVVEHDCKTKMPDTLDTMIKSDTRKYGNTSVSFYKRGDF